MRGWIKGGLLAWIRLCKVLETCESLEWLAMLNTLLGHLCLLTAISKLLDTKKSLESFDSGIQNRLRGHLWSIILRSLHQNLLILLAHNLMSVLVFFVVVFVAIVIELPLKLIEMI